MQKLFTLIAIMLTLSIHSSAQDTIKVSTATAKAIAKDLIRLDSTTAELNTCKINTSLMISSLQAKDNIIAAKDSIISLHKLNEANLNGILSLTNLQKTNLETANITLTKSLKQAKRQVVTRTVAGGVIIAALCYLLRK